METTGLFQEKISAGSRIFCLVLPVRPFLVSVTSILLNALTCASGESFLKSEVSAANCSQITFKRGDSVMPKISNFRIVRKIFSFFISLFCFGFLTVVILASCTESTVKPVSACRNTDWFERGRADGVAGLPANEIESHKKVCNSTPHPVDEDLYGNGRNVGLLEYCTPAVGVQRGKAALPYLNVCPNYLEAKFMNGYQMGGKIRILEFQNSLVEKRMQVLAQKLGRDLSTELATPLAPTKNRPRDPAGRMNSAQNDEGHELESLRRQHAELDGQILDLESEDI